MDAKNKSYASVLLIFSALIISFLALPRTSSAIGACSSVTMEILQELTIERIAFDAKMVITNNIPDKSLTNVRVDVLIQDGDGNVKNGIFFLRTPTTTSITAVDGTGVVESAASAEIHWLIIPTPGAGGSAPTGTAYFVGATLTYQVDGVQEVVPVNPARIIVKPEPQLILDYFIPPQVLADNPFTPQVEAPVPFPLAVRIMNAGYGTAMSLKIDSAQPKIVSNTTGLLADFKLLGASVNDGPVSPSLTVSIGNLDSMKISTASWSMISTLSGKFQDFKATFSHASELGGDLTSLLKETNTYYLVHQVKANLPGRDSRLDFLAYKDVASPVYQLFESEIPNNTGNVADARSPVTVVAVLNVPGRPTSSLPDVQLSVQTGQAGWVYAKLSDPGQGLLQLQDVVRSDGVPLDPNNFWIQEGLDSDFKKTFTVNVLDYRNDALAPGIYKLVYKTPADDTIPPVTQILFDGPSSGSDPLYYITPATRIILLATDNDGGSGVDQMFKKVLDRDSGFIPALPFSLETAGTYTLQYYSVDRAGNSEAIKTATIVVDNGAPVISTFQASPSTITPLAPRGLAAPRSMDFSIKATDDQPALQATIDIATGTTFTQTGVIRTLKTTITKDVQASLTWDGKNTAGTLVPTGPYTARLSVTDGLDSLATTTALSHTAVSSIAVTVADWFTGQPLDPNPTAAQQHPKVSGTRAVWQDNRSGEWQIFTKDTASGNAMVLTTNGFDHQYPAISGNIIVWQEKNLNNEWDIYGYNLATSETFSICTDPGNQERPVVDGDWVAWQDDRNGNWDIYAYNLSTHETISVTGHVRDQMHPAIFGTTLTWEDYRHGLANIYTYDLVNRTETRYTVSVYNQTFPAISGSMLAWTDQRNSQRDIYVSPAQFNEARVTYGTGDHSQSTILDGVVVYTDYETGSNDPNLSFYDTRSGLGALLSANPARQEEPSLGTGVLAWQDDRDGISQIYWSTFQVEALPISADIKTGLNLIAVGDKLARAYPTTSSLITAGANSLGIQKIVTYSSQSGLYMDTSSGSDIALQKGMAIGLYASGSGLLDLADSGEIGSYTLLPGTNYIGMLTIPNGYTGYSLLESIGFDNVQSVRRFNSQNGSWETASVRDTAGAKTAAGANFVLRPGDGVIIIMKQRVDGWKP